MLRTWDKVAGTTFSVVFSCLLIEIHPTQAATAYTFKQENFKPLNGILSGAFSGEDLNSDGFITGRFLLARPELQGELIDFSVKFESTTALPYPFVGFDSKFQNALEDASVVYSLANNFLTFSAGNLELLEISGSSQGTSITIRTPFNPSTPSVSVTTSSTAPILVKRASTPIASVPEPSSVLFLGALGLMGLRTVSKSPHSKLHRVHSR